ncbi:MAG: acetate/propionate family kinase [Pseudoxanthomonas suwonensis]|nr:acetate/propionate family kinase [Pseudoxanthomonas suwonensis]
MSDGGLLLACNAGSSTLKLGAYQRGVDGPRRLGRGLIDLRRRPLQLAWRSDAGEVALPLPWLDGEDMAALMDAALRALQQQLGGLPLEAVGHRVVHGGPHLHAPLWLDAEILGELHKLAPLAPLHQPPALRIIHALRQARPSLPQAALFDTAFHHGHDEHVTRMAIPRALHDAGVRRYGFHGLSCQCIADALRRDEPELLRGRVVVAHLGSGASLCAMHDGRSRDTSMGFSALDGIPMATRPGALDPGVPLYLIQQGMDAESLQRWLYHDCGLLGVSGISADMRELVASDAPEARQAIDLFCFRVAREVAALTNTLGGLDGLVFTAGIGEHQPEVRAHVCRHLAWLGVAVDASANAANQRRIDAGHSRVAVRVLPTDEEQVIAEALLALLRRGVGPAEAG